MPIVADGLHDALHQATEHVLAEGLPVEGVTSPNSIGSRFGTANRGSREALGVSIRIENPADRLIPAGCVPFHLGYATANFLWSVRRGARAAEILAYNSGGNPLLSATGEFQCGIPGRLVGSEADPDPLAAAIALLRDDPRTRRAIVPFITAADLAQDPRDFPCVASFHMLIRERKLHTITHMRSQALLSIFPYDVFLFTMLAEAVARLLGIGLGPYLHVCNSLHIYDDEAPRLRAVSECSATAAPMPPMTGANPLAGPELAAADEALRRDPASEVIGGDPYWDPLLDAMRSSLLFNRQRGARPSS